MTTKICNVCKEEKLLTSFAKQKLGKNGLRSYCRDCSNLYSQKYHSENLEEIRSRKRVYQREHYRNNKEIYYRNNAQRRAAKARATYEKELTAFVFEELVDLRGRRDIVTGIKWYIDHIVPLKGKNVCGLHVWNNFQLLPARENLRKTNLWDVNDGR